MDNLEDVFKLETFEAGGRGLYEALRSPRDPEDVHALVVELCRVKDRLDRLHKLVSMDDREWGRLVPRDMEGEFVIELGGALRELRQTEIVFKQLTAEISRRRLLYVDDDDDDEGGLSDL